LFVEGAINLRRKMSFNFRLGVWVKERKYPIKSVYSINAKDYSVNEKEYFSMKSDILRFIQEQSNIIQELNDQISEIKEERLENDNLYKYLISQLSLDESQYYSKYYYYVSFKFVEHLMREMVYRNEKEVNENVEKNEDGKIIASILNSDFNFSEVVVRNLQNANFSSIYPDRCIINPWNVTYSTKDNPKNERDLFEENGNGNITLLKDVYISIYELMNIIDGVDSIYEFVDEVIKVVNNSTKGMINLRKSIEYNENETDDYISTHILTIIDQSISNSIQELDNFYTFDLFDPRERIKSIDVVTDIPDELSSTVYFKNSGKIIDSHGNIYNKDGAMDSGMGLSMPIDNESIIEKNTKLFESVLRDGMEYVQDRLSDVYD